jgi:hypothetical protein
MDVAVTYVIDFDNTVKVSADEVASFRVIYNQNGKNVLTRDDAELNGVTATLKLTQEETLRFISSVRVEIQVRLLTNDGDALASDVITINVDRLLENEVLA